MGKNAKPQLAIPFDEEPVANHMSKTNHKPGLSPFGRSLRSAPDKAVSHPATIASDRGLAPAGTGRPLLIDVPTLAAQLSVTIRFVRRLIAEDRVPYLKIGKFIRFDPSEISEWLDEQRVSAA